jgi:ribosomal protein S18 acetylase RimI-like enzyme
MSYEIKTIRTLLSGKEMLYVFIELKGVVAGIIVVSHLDKDVIYIDEIFTKPNHRKKGIATTLINFIIKDAKKSSKEAITLGVDKSDGRLGKFYEKLGFKKSYCYPDNSTACMYTYYL